MKFSHDTSSDSAGLSNCTTAPLLARPQLGHAEELCEGKRQSHAAIGLLALLQQRDDRAGYRAGGGVELAVSISPSKAKPVLYAQRQDRRCRCGA